VGRTFVPFNETAARKAGIISIWILAFIVYCCHLRCLFPYTVISVVLSCLRNSPLLERDGLLLFSIEIQSIQFFCVGCGGVLFNGDQVALI
jgi:hypothetical protein